MIALTIDDGPADPYTAQILDELKKLNVKATFFLIGQNAERYPDLVRRIWDEGHEIGNHSYTHPNIGAISTQRRALELNATQRVFQSRCCIVRRCSFVRRTTPTPNRQAPRKSTPIELASELNYITVLEFLDPQDWNTRRSATADGSIHHRTARGDAATRSLRSSTSRRGAASSCTTAAAIASRP